MNTPAPFLPPAVLALDPSTWTGWARRDHAGRVEHGVAHFPKTGSDGDRFGEFRAWLARAVLIPPGILAVQVVAFELPHLRGKAARELLLGFATIVRELAATHRAQVLEVHTGTLKKHATGRGDADKADVIAAMAKRWGIPAKDFEPGGDRADALAVLAWALDEIGVAT